jgi:hypothetical protein
MAENHKNHKEPYWAGKKVCNAFERMETHIAKPPEAPRKLLLKGAEFLSAQPWR